MLSPELINNNDNDVIDKSKSYIVLYKHTFIIANYIQTYFIEKYV